MADSSTLPHVVGHPFSPSPPDATHPHAPNFSFLPSPPGARSSSSSTPSDGSSTACSDGDRNGTDAARQAAIKQGFEAEMKAEKEEVWKKGARSSARAEVAHTAANDIKNAENDKKAAYALFEKALGVDMKNLMASSACFAMAQALPKLMFLWIIVGCELDLYGFMMSISSYWALEIAPLRILLVTGPAGYIVAVTMFLVYSNYYAESDDVPYVPKPIKVNPFTPTTHGDLEAGSKSLPVNVIDTKEPIHLKFYHFIPIVRYYLVIKDNNPSDVEGLFRVNSLSSFTLGISQICGIMFSLKSGEPLDIFVKINIASQMINWTITLLYFATSISNRMKGSFKVETLLYNSVSGLKKEYESYVNCVLQASSEGGRECVWKDEIKRFDDSLNFEISEFVKQDVDLSMFSMHEKYQIRIAIRKRMFSTYMKIK
jgi:hypothetical protein